MLIDAVHTLSLILKDYPDDGSVKAALKAKTQSINVIFISTFTLSPAANELLEGALTKGLKLSQQQYSIKEITSQEELGKFTGSLDKESLIFIFGKAFPINDTLTVIQTFSAEELLIDKDKKRIFWANLQDSFKQKFNI